MEEIVEAVADALPAKGLQVKPEHKAEWVRRFRQSGLSLRKFCGQYGLRCSSLCRWTNGEYETRLTSSTPSFVEVKLPALASEQPRWVAELDLGNGKVLRISAEVPEAVLEQLLRVC